jgi:hypothetical protein
MSKLIQLGEVANGYSNFLSLLAVDAPHASAWRGPSGGGKDDDFERANKQAEKGKLELALGGGRGVICEVGGCGATNVYRASADTLVFVEHYSDDWDDEIEADFLDKIAVTPTAKKPKRLGTCEVKSGALALVALVEGVEKLSAKDIAKVAGGGKAKEYDWGLLVPMPKGDYEIWGEQMSKLEGEWGSIESRIRIVPKGTKVTPGEPIVRASTPAETSKGSKTSKRTGADRRRLVVDGWEAVDSFAVSPDGKQIFAGQCGGFGVCAWNEAGELLWKTELAKPSREARYSDTVLVRIGAKGTILALPGHKNVLNILDAATGGVRAKHPITPEVKASSGDLRGCALTPDGKTIVLRVGTDVFLYAFPSMKLRAALPGYCNMDHIAISPDGRWLFVCGHEVHVFELPSGKHVVTFEPPESPWASAFSPDSKTLATGADDGKVRLYAAPKFQLKKELDIAPDRSRKSTINSLAFDPQGKTLATAGEDGAVKVFDTKTLELLVQLDKHETTVPDTGSRQLSQVGFMPSGELVVSAGLKKEPIGLSIYPKPR